MATRREKKSARIVQELTAMSYCQALDLLRTWTAKDLSWEDELIKLAKEKTPEEKELEKA